MAGFLRSLQQIFTGNTRSNSLRRDQTMSSTHDAFSIPNHSPTLPTFQDGPNSQGNDYSYPPARTTRHDDLDDNSHGQSNPRAGGTILPLHSASSSGPYPPIHQSWSRLQSWLRRNYPELGDTLNYGILPEDLQEIQLQFGFPLPPTMRESYLHVDGQDAESSAGCTEGLFFGLSLLSLEEVQDEWRFWREVDSDPATGANPKLQQRMKSIPTGWIRCEYSNPGWLPLATDRVGNYLGIDLNPGEKGSPGQVFIFGRDFDTKVVVWRGDGEGGWAKWLAAFAEELETGETFEVGNQDTNSEGSEDSIGHEPYFFDGSANGNRGEGGGDGGAVGIRLTGEYRGWNVLEALADRSVKKWKEAGVVTEEEFPTVDTRRITGLVGLHPLQQDTSGVEVPIPLIEDLPTTSSLEGPSTSASAEKALTLSPETPRVRSHAPSKPSLSLPQPRPIVLPTKSDIDVDVATSSLDDSDGLAPGEDQDIERGNRLPLRNLEVKGPNATGTTPLHPTFSPRISEEDSRLLKQIAVEPPTPVTTDADGNLVTLPHKRKSPSPEPDEDLLGDDAPQLRVNVEKDGSSVSGSTRSEGSTPYLTPLDTAPTSRSPVEGVAA